MSAADKKETGKKGELAGSDPCLAVDGEKEPKPEGEEKEEGKDTHNCCLRQTLSPW